MIRVARLAIMKTVGRESAAVAGRCATHRARRRGTSWIIAVIVAAACGDLEQAAETTGTGDEGSGSEGSGPLPDDGDSMPPLDDGSGDASEGGSSTGEPPSDSSGNPLPRGCGDGIMDAGEQCDDGNADETDDCTSLCAPPSCEDRIQSGAETGIDCGGSCDGCPLDDACSTSSDCMGGLVCGDGLACAWPRSCLQLLTAWPETESGGWPLDPDGDGVSESFPCDMTPGDAGWTRVLSEDFASDSGDAWSQTETSSCGAMGEMLGGYDEFAGITVTRPVELFMVPHTEARLEARYIKIGSWDSETAFAQIDGAQVWSDVFAFDEGTSDECGDLWPEGAHAVLGQTGHGADTMTIAFGATLDQAADNEAWGVDDVEVWLR